VAVCHDDDDYDHETNGVRRSAFDEVRSRRRQRNSTLNSQLQHRCVYSTTGHRRRPRSRNAACAGSSSRCPAHPGRSPRCRPSTTGSEWTPDPSPSTAERCVDADRNLSLDAARPSPALTTQRLAGTFSTVRLHPQNMKDARQRPQNNARLDDTFAFQLSDINAGVDEHSLTPNPTQSKSFRTRSYTEPTANKRSVQVAGLQPTSVTFGPNSRYVARIIPKPAFYSTVSATAAVTTKV